MASPGAYTVLLVDATPDRVEQALTSVLGQGGFRRTLGLAPGGAELHLDPHERSRRHFRIVPTGPWTAVVELGTDTGADYLLVAPLAACRIGRVAYAALSQDGSGVLALHGPGSDTGELWLDAGTPDADLSTLQAPDGDPQALLRSWEAPVEPPRFETCPGAPLSFLREAPA
jgi:hypothetical protein